MTLPILLMYIKKGLLLFTISYSAIIFLFVGVILYYDAVASFEKSIVAMISFILFFGCSQILFNGYVLARLRDLEDN